MRNIIGVLVIIAFIPLIAILQQGILNEWHDANAYKEQLNKAIVLETSPIDLPITLKDRHGSIFAEQYIEWRRPVKLDEVPHFVQDIFIQSEDREFYNHRGYDVAAIARAILANSDDNRQQGASTITQQLVRMKFLTTEKTYERKVKEILYAAEVENKHSKDQILEMYLNEMYFANQVYGIGGAATYYFNRPLHELSKAEVTFIAAIPNNPSVYNPLRNFENTKKRQERLLDTLKETEIMTSEEAEQAKKEKIVLEVKRKKDEAPMYSDTVLDELPIALGETFGLSKAMNEATTSFEREEIQRTFNQYLQSVTEKGLIINTALDLHKQLRDEQRLNQLVQPDPLQAAAAVIDVTNGEIVSLYAGRHYKKAGFNRAYRAVHQPASAFKPILVYGPFLESGRYSADSPVDSRNICIGNYCPRNIGGATYGTTSLSSAFRYSHNTAAVRALRSVGLNEAFEYLEQFDFKHITPEDRNFAAALGGLQYGVTPLELASAYSSFHDGSYTSPHTIRSIQTLEGEVLYEAPFQPKTVWSTRTAQTMKQLLQDTVRNGTAKGVTTSTSYTGAKTGTSDHYRDIWVAGLNDTYATAVWVGYDQKRSVQWASDAKIHLRAFSQLLSP